MNENHRLKSVKSRAKYLFALGFTTGQVAYILDIDLDRAVHFLECMPENEIGDERIKRKTEEFIYNKTKRQREKEDKERVMMYG